MEIASHPSRQHGRSTGRRIAAVALAGLACSAGAGLLVAPPASAAPSLAQLEAVRAREQRLASQVATYTRLIDRLSTDVASLQRRQAALESDLRTHRERLVRTQGVLERERSRLAALKARLAHSRHVLAGRLVAMYKADDPDVVSVVISSRGFVDLLERAEFLRRIGEQDRAIILRVRAERDDVQRTTDRLAVLEARQRRQTNLVLRRRDQVAETRSLLDAKRAGIASARADVRFALRAVSARRGRLENRLAALGAASGRLGADLPALGALAGWAIPWRIVNCESGGRNHPPNHAGASGYYQIIPSTWKAFGGRGPAAYLAPKAEQDRVAARIWRGGAGARNWVCAYR